MKVTLAKLCKERLGLKAELGEIIIFIVIITKIILWLIYTVDHHQDCLIIACYSLALVLSERAMARCIYCICTYIVLSLTCCILYLFTYMNA